MKIVFEGDYHNSPKLNRSNSNDRMVNLLIRNSNGLIKNEQIAKLILFIFSFLLIVVSIHLLKSTFSLRDPEPVTYPDGINGLPT